MSQVIFNHELAQYQRDSKYFFWYIASMIRVILFSFICLILNAHSYAQGLPSGGSSGGDDILGEKNFAFMPIPYINYDRSLGFQVGALPMAMYKVNKEDSISPASLSGIFGMYTTNESWFGLVFQQFYLKEDNWRVTAAGGIGSINFQFYMQSPINQFIDYITGANFLYLMGQKKIVENLYGGLHFMYADLFTAFTISDDQIEAPQIILRGLGGVFSFDKRDDVYYPYEGFITNLLYSTFPDFLENEFVSQKIDFDFNKYWSVRQHKDVLAGRVFLGTGIGDLSFQQQYIVGMNDNGGDIRGYTQGTYRGDQLYALQGEYRWNFHKTLSSVFFAGIATVTGSINPDHNGRILPGAGTGFRVNVAPQYHMNVGMDVAVGDGDWGIYFRIGEAF